MNHFGLRRAVLGIALSSAFLNVAVAQVALTGTGAANQYTQNFDSLANTPATGNVWTDNSTLQGWYSTRTTYNANNGGSNAGALYSFGAASASERALGGIGSGGTGTFYWAVRLVNNTGFALSSIDVSFVGEQWRDGGATTPAAQTMPFDYQVADADTITGANTPATGWTSFSALNFTSPTFTNTGSGTALDGNAGANRTAKSSNIPMDVAPGQEIWLRWTDNNDGGNDHGLAVDDLVVVANAAGPTLSITAPAATAEGNSGTTDFTFTVELSEPAPAGGVTFDIATADDTATEADGDYVGKSLTSQTIAEGDSEYQFTVQVNGDTAAELDETFFVNVSNIVGTGFTTTSAQATGTITNDDATPLSIDVTGVSKPEGNSGTTDYVFSVTLSGPAPAGGVTFDIATSDVTATAASGDYVAKQLTGQSFAEGQDTYEFTVQVNGDTKFEADETFHVDVTNISGSNVDSTAQQGTGTITNDDTATIGDIQGDGLASPFAGQSMSTSGVVTAVGASSFAMQDAPEVADGDADTSDGIIVFTGSTPTVAVGDTVSVTGTVQEFNGQTEISGTPVVLVTGMHDPIVPIVLDTTLPSPNPLVHLCAGTLPATNADAGNWECLEGMLVQIDGVVVGATNGGGAADGTHAGTPGFFYATVAGAPRPFREPGVEYPGLQDALHPDVPVFDGDPEIIEFYPPGAIGGPTSLVLNAGQHFSSTSIVGDFKGTYELYPATWSLTGDAPQTVQPVPASAEGTLTIASQNMLHFFNDVHDSGSIDGCTPGSADTCETTPQFTIRKQKLSRQIRDVLGAPAVVGVQEVENLATLQALADQIHFDDPSLTYAAYLSEGNDIGGIDVGVLVRDDVTVNAVTQLGKSTLTTGDACNASPCPKLNDRPPLLLDATFNGYHFAVLVIHNRSLNDADTARVQAKRLQQAQYVAEIMQTWQTGSGAPLSDGDVVPNPDANAPIVVLGDYNAYEFTDGYVDVTGQIKGAVNADENKLSATPITSPTLCDAGLTTAASTRYSFQFDGYVQELDHSLLSRVGWRDFVSLANAHGNADTSEAGPEVTDPATPARSADHDGQVLTLAPDRILADDNEGDTCH